MTRDYSLKQDEYGYFVDQDGCSHESPAMWFWIAILGGCGCGNAGDLADKALALLRFFAERNERVFSYTEGNEILAHWFDSKKLTEHGGTVGGSWLTKDGKAVLKAVQEVTMNDL